jgi:synaptobrevin family protein YKT6
MHLYVRLDGLTGVVITDNKYPERIAQTLINKMLFEYDANNKDKTKIYNIIESLFNTYQDIKEADKITKIQSTLDEIKDIMHKNIEQVMNRGEKIDDLVIKSNELSEASKIFFNSGRRLKRKYCCRFW